MVSSEPVEKRYEAAFKDAVALNPVFPFEAKRQMSALLEEALRADGMIDKLSSTGQSVPIKAGLIAEEFHRSTFNADAIVKGSGARAYTDRAGGVLPKNDQVVDIAVVDQGQVVVSAQSKYNATPASTAFELSALDPKTKLPKYAEVDQRISPADQLQHIERIAAKKADFEAGKSARLQNSGNGPDAAEASAKSTAYSQTAETATDRLEYKDVSSSPLTKRDAEGMGKGDRKALQDAHGGYQARSTVQQAANAAGHAAVLAAVFSGSVNTLRYLSDVRAGRLSPAEATAKIVAETAATAADSAIKAGLVTGTHSVLTRVTGTTVAGSLGTQGVGAIVRSNAVSVAVVCAVNLVKDLVLLARGDITAEAFEERQGKGLLSTAAGTAGGSLGAAAMAALGATAGLPLMFGGLAGGLIVGVATEFAIETGIEAPFRDLVRNTATLHDAARILDTVSREVFEGQVRFAAFLEEGMRQDAAFRLRMQDGAVAAAALRTAIDRI